MTRDYSAAQPARWWTTSIGILGLWLFATLLNFGKAYHIDDTAHLEIARWIAENPLRPMSGLVSWGDDMAPIHEMNQPHLYFYLMAAWAQVFGWSEAAMHALMALFSLWAVLAIYRLARLVTPGFELPAAALFALGPGFVVGQNSMVDVPLVAMWIEFYRVLLDPAVSNRRRYASAALLCSAALLVKYTSLVLLPALLIHLILERRWKQLPWALLPLGALVAWSLFNWVDYGGVHLLGRKAEPRNLILLRDAAIAWVMALGAIAPFALWLFAGWASSATWRPASWAAISALLLCATGLLLALMAPVMGFTTDLLYAPLKVAFLMMSGGPLLVVGILAVKRAAGQGVGVTGWLLLYWLVSAGTFIIVLAPFAATRHALLALPPLMLLAIAWTGPRMPPAASALALTSSMLLTVPLAAGDRWYAEVYRQAPGQIRAAIAVPGKVWFTAHWGWQWYAAEAGFEQMSASGSRPSIGDYVVTPRFVSSSALPVGLVLEPYLEIVVRRQAWQHHFASSSAGLYSSSRWKLPWTSSAAPIEVFDISRVVATP
ncbi:MAG: glycosyltransferase family 39 protein [Burkholderiales bacterium]|nr:glycosyltransferase family 39 protein [Burkholderiales bacterium]